MTIGPSTAHSCRVNATVRVFGGHLGLSFACCGGLCCGLAHDTNVDGSSKFASALVGVSRRCIKQKMRLALSNSVVEAESLG